MPSKKKKYNARFPAGRIKKIMQSDEEIGKVAQAVPVIISRTLELFVESLLNKTVKITNSRNAKTLSTSHMKQCIMSEQRFDFLRELVKNIPDISVAEEAAANYNEEMLEMGNSSPDDSDTPYDLSLPSTSMRASRTAAALVVSPNATTANGGAADCLQSNGLPGSQRAHLKRSFSTVIRHTSTNACVELSQTDPHLRERVSQQIGGAVALTAVDTQRSSNHNSSSQNALDELSVRAPKQTTPLHINEKSTQHTAIPPPIVSYDFYNKPVVKIEYSNLSAATASGTVEISKGPATTTMSAQTHPPHSAPADMASGHTSESAFDFNPVINIDLSNIVTAGIVTNKRAASKPAIQAGSGHKPTASGTTSNQSSFFELDEDYDNI